ncbi:zinc ABC transporter substrate-binding protein [Tropicimonas marinistellae]|uniref:zinc ABC transporter substrate-binding protein n=1 Tax=Tropicimonas marinistellae TaxID=1739787 RepID=UPI000832FBCE|nr:zinc ABC transporter substrate-binding protein [Tropicimonas marinistellae]
MPRHIARPCAAAILLPTLAFADVPTVATDIAPVHSLVAQVMGELGEPALTVPPGASPHSYAMRPSEARALSDADVVVWMGEALTPWLEDPIATLAEGADVLELLDVPGSVIHEFRETAIFAGGDEHTHDDHDDGHEAGHEHDEHEGTGDDGHDDHDGNDHHDHAHEGLDPHAWLDPENARVWLAAIAEALSVADPDNAGTYESNARSAQARLDKMEAEIASDLSPIRNIRYVVFHDAYQYFERRFGIQAVGAITLSDAAGPSAARIAELRDEVASRSIDCVVSQPQFNPDLVQAVVKNGTAQTTVIDPIGVGLPRGAGLYEAMMRSMASGLVACQ